MLLRMQRGCVQIRTSARRWCHPAGRGAKSSLRQHAGGFALGDVVRLAGAARLGEVQVDRCNWHDWWGRAGLQNSIMHDEGAELEYFHSRSMKLEDIFVEQIFANGYAKLFSGHSESAPVHISAVSARRRGPILAIKLSRRDC